MALDKTKKDERYLLFAYRGYQMQGGLDDLESSYATISEAIKEAKSMSIGDDLYVQVYDRLIGKQINLEQYENISI